MRDKDRVLSKKPRKKKGKLRAATTKPIREDTDVTGGSIDDSITWSRLRLQDMLEKKHEEQRTFEEAGQRVRKLEDDERSQIVLSDNCEQQVTGDGQSTNIDVKTAEQDDKPFMPWMPYSTKQATVDPYSHDAIVRTLTSLLNKLTMANFKSISAQLVICANVSERASGGVGLDQVVRVVLGRAINEAMWSDMYANLCQKMIENITPEERHDGYLKEGSNGVTGGQHFREILLIQCHNEIERAMEAINTVEAVIKASDEQADAHRNCEPPLHPNYYDAQKVRRVGLGIIKFYGELFKRQIWEERTMEMCMKLLPIEEHSGQLRIEWMCQLLSAVGQRMEIEANAATVDRYFLRLKAAKKHWRIQPRVRFALEVRY